MSKDRTFPTRILGGWLLVLVLVLGWNTIYADDFYVVAVGKKATGPPAPVEKTGQTYSARSGDDGNLQKGVPWPNPRFSEGTYVVTVQPNRINVAEIPTTYCNNDLVFGDRLL